MKLIDGLNLLSIVDSTNEITSGCINCSYYYM